MFYVCVGACVFIYLAWLPEKFSSFPIDRSFKLNARKQCHCRLEQSWVCYSIKASTAYNTCLDPPITNSREELFGNSRGEREREREREREEEMNK